MSSYFSKEEFWVVKERETGKKNVKQDSNVRRGPGGDGPLNGVSSRPVGEHTLKHSIQWEGKNRASQTTKEKTATPPKRIIRGNVNPKSWGP